MGKVGRSCTEICSSVNNCYVSAAGQLHEGAVCQSLLLLGAWGRKSVGGGSGWMGGTSQPQRSQLALRLAFACCNCFGTNSCIYSQPLACTDNASPDLPVPHMLLMPCICYWCLAYSIDALHVLTVPLHDGIYLLGDHAMVFYSLSMRGR